MPLIELNSALGKAFAETRTEPGKQPLIRSLLLLWHDHLDESHTLSQEIHNPDGSLLHGIMHRREPDYANAKYWFNRVGQHPAYPVIAERITQFFKEKNEAALLNELLPSGRWNPNAFVDASQRAERSPAPSTEILRQIQEIEFRVLLEHFCEVEP